MSVEIKHLSVTGAPVLGLGLRVELGQLPQPPQPGALSGLIVALLCYPRPSQLLAVLPGVG